MSANGPSKRRKRVGPTKDENECARLVRDKKPDALGATRYRSGSCLAVYGTTRIYGAHSHGARCCIFLGNNSSYLLTFIF